MGVLPASQGVRPSVPDSESVIKQISHSLWLIPSLWAPQTQTPHPELEWRSHYNIFSRLLGSWDLAECWAVTERPQSQPCPSSCHSFHQPVTQHVLSTLAFKRQGPEAGSVYPQEACPWVLNCLPTRRENTSRAHPSEQMVLQLPLFTLPSLELLPPKLALRE